MLSSLMLGLLRCCQTLRTTQYLSRAKSLTLCCNLREGKCISTKAVMLAILSLSVRLKARLTDTVLTQKAANSLMTAHFWGSKRTGPDFARVGNYRTSDWHENHMLDPKSVVPSSIMPAYKHLFKKNADVVTAYAEALTVKKVFNVPYDVEGQTPLGTLEEAQEGAKAEAQAIVDAMKDPEIKAAFENGEIKEIVALIAYLNSLK